MTTHASAPLPVNIHVFVRLLRVFSEVGVLEEPGFKNSSWAIFLDRNDFECPSILTVIPYLVPCVGTEAQIA